MYINYELMFKKGISLEELNTLIQINQKEGKLLEGKDFSRFEELNLVTYVKPVKDIYNSVRLSKNGKTFLDALTTKGFTEEVGNLLKKLTELYELSNKDTGNLLEVRKRLIWFIEETGFSEKVIYNAVDTYLTDNSEYTMNLDNLLWRAPSKAFSVHYNLKDSRLFDIISKQFRLPITFFVKDSITVEETWLRAISHLNIPKKLDNSLYFTGSYKTELEFQQMLKVKLAEKMKNCHH